MTLHALHQTGSKGNHEGHAATIDKEFNVKSIGKSIGKYNFGKGVTSQTQYFTKYLTTGDRTGVSVIHRKSGAMVGL